MTHILKLVMTFTATASIAAAFPGSAIAQVLPGVPHQPDLDVTECPRSEGGRFDLEFEAPYVKPNGEYASDVVYVPTGVFVLMSQSDFGFGTYFGDPAGYSDPDRFALKVCADNALATIMAKRKGQAHPQIAQRPAAPQAAPPLAISPAAPRTAPARPVPVPPVQQSSGIAATQGSPQIATTQNQAPQLLPGEATELKAVLDDIIQRDSRSWFINRYNSGSVHNVRILQSDPSRNEIQGDYKFNGSRNGWIRVRFNGDQVDCITYHDFPGTCRAIGKNPAAARALTGLAITAFAAGMAGGSGGYGTSTRQRPNNCPPDAISCNGY